MLSDKLDADLKDAIKAKDQIKVSTIRVLKASVMNVAISKKADKLDDDEVMQVISKQIKQRKESIESFKKGNRQDLVDKETKELHILQSYMPEALSQQEVAVIINNVIKQTGACGKADMGKVMKPLMEAVKSRFDAKLLSQLVVAELEKMQGNG